MRALAIIAILFAVLTAGLSLKSSAATNSSGGALVYEVRCASCHQATGRGTGPFPALAHNADVVASDTQQLIATVLEGRTGPVRISGKQYGSTMPAFKDVLSNAEIAAVLTYVRSSWGNRAPAISEDQIAAAAKPVAFSGATIFVTTCGNCHPSGGGATASAPPLDANPHVTAADPRPMLAIIVNGMSGAVTVNNKTYDAPMPSWHARLSNGDVAAVATYIRSAWSNHASAVTEQEVGASGPAVSVAIGHSIYDARCAACHGQNGSGVAGVSLAGSAHVTAVDPGALIRTVLVGRNAMPSWRGQLSNADIASVLTYIRSAWSNKAAPVAESAVAAQ